MSSWITIGEPDAPAQQQKAYECMAASQSYGHPYPKPVIWSSLPHVDMVEDQKQIYHQGKREINQTVKAKGAY